MGRFNIKLIIDLYHLFYVIPSYMGLLPKCMTLNNKRQFKQMLLNLYEIDVFLNNFPLVVYNNRSITKLLSNSDDILKINIKLMQAYNTSHKKNNWS